MSEKNVLEHSREKMSKLYLFSLLIGFIIFVVIYLKWNGSIYEGFKADNKKKDDPKKDGASKAGAAISNFGRGVISGGNNDKEDDKKENNKNKENIKNNIKRDGKNNDKEDDKKENNKNKENIKNNIKRDGKNNIKRDGKNNIKVARGGQPTSVVRSSGVPSSVTPELGSSTSSYDRQATQAIINNLVASFSNITKTNIGELKYKETVSSIPKNANLRTYLSSFSDVTSYNVASYEPSIQKWNNHVRNTKPYFMLTASPPANISNGLPLKNIKLQGDSSITLGVRSGQTYVLDQFTFSFYMKVQSLEPGSVISILKVATETPSLLEIELATTISGVDLNTKMAGGVTYTHSLTTQALLADDIFISCVFDKDASSANKFRYFINNLEFIIASQRPPTITLGTSDMTINDGLTLDATLYSFMFFNTAISKGDHDELLRYIGNQRSGLDPFIYKINSLTTTELDNINSILSTKNLSIAALNTQLEQCRALEDEFNKAAVEKEKDKWSVRTDGENIQLSPDDLNKCSILKIK